MGFPAARMTDLHICPMAPPPGLPIAMPCKPNVLIGYLPAARMTDLCVCVGPPPPAGGDPIITGAYNVLIGNLPAARMTDLTAKGGTIATGFPSVLIGMNGVVAPAVIPPVCFDLQAELDDLQDAAAMARLAAAAYDDAPSDENLPDGMRRATPEELQNLGLVDPATGYDATRIDDSDFRADVFVSKDPVSGEDNYTIAFQGTTPTSTADWGANLGQGAGMESEYYNQATEVGRAAELSAPGRVRFTGHSLGGGLASAAAVATGAQGTTFNAAGLHPSTAERAGGGNANVDAWHNESDPLSRLQDANDWMAPSAAGRRRPLPPTTQWTPEERAIAESYVDSENWTPDWIERKRGQAEAAAKQQLRFHSMEEMEQIIQNDIERVKNEKKANGCP